MGAHDSGGRAVKELLTAGYESEGGIRLFTELPCMVAFKTLCEEMIAKSEDMTGFSSTADIHVLNSLMKVLSEVVPGTLTVDITEMRELVRSAMQVTFMQDTEWLSNFPAFASAMLVETGLMTQLELWAFVSTWLIDHKPEHERWRISTSTRAGRFIVTSLAIRAQIRKRQEALKRRKGLLAQAARN